MSQTPIPSPVLVELQRQFNHELSAAHAYHALSVWCAAGNLKGFAEFFAKQSGEEREHAGRFIKHLLDRGALPGLAEIARPRQDFRSLVEVARHTIALEQANTRGIHAVYEAALAARDYPAQVFVQWFINEQVEEEAWCAELIARVESATCAGSLGDLDRHIVGLLTARGGSAS